MSDPNPKDEFLDLIQNHQRMLWKVCWAYASHQADRDDLFQEILARLWAAFPRYDRQRRFSTWMYRVALNVAIDAQRRRSRTGKVAQLEDANLVPANRPPDDGPQLSELHALMETLEQADRAILLLYLESHSYREIGEILGLSASNVGTRISRIKQTLRKRAASPSKADGYASA